MKILILGTGSAQRDAVEYLKKNGHCVWGISFIEQGQAQAGLDQFNRIDIADKASVLDHVRTNGIELVYSAGSDLAMPTVGYVSESLNLPYFIGETIASKLNDKGKSRRFLTETGICPIRYACGAHPDDLLLWSRFPVMVKPVDSQGQRGVCRVDSPAELSGHVLEALRHSASGRVIVEEFLEGPEISVNSFVYQGRAVYHFISSRRSLEKVPGGVVQGHDFPARIPEAARNQALDIANRIIGHLPVKNGPVYFQMKLTADGVKVIEASARLDGCHLWRLIRYACGVDLLALTFDLLTGKRPDFPEAGKPSSPLSLDFVHLRPGTVFFRDRVASWPPGTRYAEFYYRDGETVRPINGYAEKVGYCIH